MNDGREDSGDETLPPTIADLLADSSVWAVAPVGLWEDVLDAIQNDSSSGDDEKRG